MKALWIALSLAWPVLAETVPDGRHIVPGADVAAAPFATWIEDGTVRTASGADIAAQAPAQAVRYAVKAVKWPTGTVRVLTFSGSAGGVLHLITDETELYVLSGSAVVDVGGAATPIAAGDAVSRPNGALRNGSQANDAVILAWSVGSTVANPKPMIVRAGDVTAETTAEWLDGDKVMRTATTADTNAKAPAHAVKLISRRYNFDGNSIRVARFVKGGTRQPAKMTADSLIYVTGGPVRFHQADETAIVNAGDFIREEAGLSHVWEQLSDGGFITTTGVR